MLVSYCDKIKIIHFDLRQCICLEMTFPFFYKNEMFIPVAHYKADVCNDSENLETEFAILKLYPQIQGFFF